MQPQMKERWNVRCNKLVMLTSSEAISPLGCGITWSETSTPIGCKSLTKQRMFVCECVTYEFGGNDVT